MQRFQENFLLGLIRESKAEYLVTGDKDLLVLNPFEGTEILEPAEFEKQIIKGSAYNKQT